jgi:hypothetical protein
MKFSRNVSLVFVATLFGCGDAKHEQQPPEDTSASSTSFTGSFGDSAKPDTTKPTPSSTTPAPPPADNRPTAGTTDTGMVRPSGAGTTDTAAVSAGGRLGTHVYRPTAGVYDTAVAPPPVPTGLQGKKRITARSAGVHR